MKNPSRSVSGLPLYSPADYKAKLDSCFAGVDFKSDLPSLYSLTYGHYKGIFYRRGNKFATYDNKNNGQLVPFTREEFRDELLRIVAEVDPTHALRVAAALSDHAPETE